jgi:hypothetical protein
MSPRRSKKEKIGNEWNTQLLICTDDVNMLGEYTNAIRNTEALLEANREVGHEVNREKTKHTVTSPKCRTESKFSGC